MKNNLKAEIKKNMEKSELKKMIDRVQETVKSQPDELKMFRQKQSEEDYCKLKTLSTVQRMEIAKNIILKYSMLKKENGIFHDQLFSAMEDYLEQCGIAGVIDLMQTCIQQKTTI